MATFGQPQYNLQSNPSEDMAEAGQEDPSHPAGCAKVTNSPRVRVLCVQ